MSGKKIAIVGAGIVPNINGIGLLNQIEITNPKQLNNDDFMKWAKSIFSERPPGPRTIIIGYDFAVGYRKEYGDDKFYEFVANPNIEIQCGEDTYNYIMDFVKWYELKDSQRNKPKLKKK